MSSPLKTKEYQTDSASATNTSIKDDVTIDVAADAQSGLVNAIDEVKGPKLALIVFGLCFSNILTGRDFTLVATAISVITSDFNSLEDVGWYGSAYFVAMCVALPLAGKIYMFFPKKLVYLAYIGVSIGLMLLFLHLQRSPTEMGALKIKLKKLDLLGFTIFAGAILMLLLALQWGGVAYAWSSSFIVGLLVGFGVMFAMFVVSQWWMADSALVPPKLFTFRTVVLAFGACLLGPGGVATIIYYLPIWFQAVQGVTPIASGVRYLPSVISDVLTSIIGAVSS
ncbi:hypothetical protein GQ44DRAFT_780132 [Phaeosphaeriaceae sp. PMI808]|nr:hypothetical protein GQ44DRAFT_780132 [Phaeosphaeriaceae sp. PMI808]